MITQWTARWQGKKDWVLWHSDQLEILAETRVQKERFPDAGSDHGDEDRWAGSTDPANGLNVGVKDKVGIFAIHWKEEPGTGEGADLVRNSWLFNINLRYLLDIQVQMSSGQLDIWICGSEKKFRLNV